MPDNLIMTTSSAAAVTMTDEELCVQERYWSYFLASSLITFFVGLFAILSWKLVSHVVNLETSKKPMISRTEDGPDECGRYGNDARETVGMMTRLKWAAEECISGQTKTGKILVRYDKRF